MKRWLWGVGFGVILGSAAHGETTRHGDAPIQRLEEMRVHATTDQDEFTLPAAYGRLVSVAIRAEVHHLYFEGTDGTVRIVLIGPRGSIQRARSELQLLSSEVHVITRGEPRERL